MESKELKARSNDILKLIDAISDGHHVYSGMVHQTRAISYLTQALRIADEIENREYQNAKRIDELNHIVESWKFQYQSLCEGGKVMKAEKTRSRLEILQEIVRIDADIFYELTELEAKATELDRREKGVAVIKRPTRWDACGYCKVSIAHGNTIYCHRCGTKLIRDEVE